MTQDDLDNNRALDLLEQLVDKTETGPDAIFLPRDKAIQCVADFLRAIRKEAFEAADNFTLALIAEEMGEHVENWPEPKRVKTAVALIGKTLRAALDPPRHAYWAAGESDCPCEIKAGNGELHTLRCKVCGKDNPRDDRCLP